MAHTIVLIDDDEDVCENMRDLLTAHGFEVATATSGRAGLELLASLDSPCFVLVDLMMPEMTGWELIAELEKNPSLSQLAVYVWTSIPEKAPPGRPVLRKPLDVGALIDEIRSHCSH